MLSHKVFIFYFLILLLSTPWVAASENEIHIEADKVEMDEKSGTSSYIGNVKLSQDNLTIHAETLTVYADKSSLSKIIAIGKPARFDQAATAKSPNPVSAEAKRIEYNAIALSLKLTSNVELRHGENRFTGEKVQYDIRNNIMKASGDENKKRVQAIIQLDNLNQIQAP